MGAFRGVVLPVLRLLVWTVIAIALCVLAFGKEASPSDTLTPQMNEQQATVKVAKGDVSSTLQLTGSVRADPAATVKSPVGGTVSRIRVNTGERVEVGTPLFNVTTTKEATNATTAPTSTVRVVRSNAVGTLKTLDVLDGQAIDVGASVATVSPGTLQVVAPLTQSQQFRLLDPPDSAQVQATGGPAPFTCQNLAVGSADSGSNDNADPNASTPPGGYVDPMGGQPEATTAQLSCPVPAGTTIFAGMSVTVTIDTGSATDTLTLPTSAVEGAVGTGYVWVPGPQGSPLRKQVSLGLTDGSVVQIKSGLSEGDEVLEFAPVNTGQDPAAGAPSAGATP